MYCKYLIFLLLTLPVITTAKAVPSKTNQQQTLQIDSVIQAMDSRFQQLEKKNIELTRGVADNSYEFFDSFSSVYSVISGIVALILVIIGIIGFKNLRASNTDHLNKIESSYQQKIKDLEEVLSRKNTIEIEKTMSYCKEMVLEYEKDNNDLRQKYYNIESKCSSIVMVYNTIIAKRLSQIDLTERDEMFESEMLKGPLDPRNDNGSPSSSNSFDGV